MVSFQSPLFKPGAPSLGKACSLLTGFLAEPSALTGGDHPLLREDPDIRKDPDILYMRSWGRWNWT